MGVLRTVGALALAWVVAAAAVTCAPTKPIAPDPVESLPTPLSSVADSAATASWEPDIDELRARADRLVELAFTDGRAHALLADLCATAPGRLAGSPADAAAVRWSLETMRELGLDNVRAEPVTVPRWVRGPEEVAYAITDAGREDLDVLALGGSVATPPDGITAEVIMVRSFAELRNRADEARGKIVFFNRPMPRALMNTFAAYGRAVPQRSNGATETARVGGVFALVRSMTTARDDVPHTGAMRYTDGIPRVPTAAISTVDADRVGELVASGKPVVLHLELGCRTLPDAESANVVGELVGTERPDEIVVVGGHLDSWDVGQGAHDDGAGCAHALEAVRLLQVAGLRPRRTIRVVLFANEENGLRGATAYEETHRGAMGKHVAAIESDRGGFEPRGFTCSAKGARFDALEKVVDCLDGYGTGALLPGGGGADIAPLGPHGVALFGLVTVSHRYFDYHHSAADTIDKVNERELALGAASIAFLLSALGDYDFPVDGS